MSWKSSKTSTKGSGQITENQKTSVIPFSNLSYNSGMSKIIPSLLYLPFLGTHTFQEVAILTFSILCTKLIFISENIHVLNYVKCDGHGEDFFWGGCCLGLLGYLNTAFMGGGEGTVTTILNCREGLYVAIVTCGWLNRNSHTTPHPIFKHKPITFCRLTTARAFHSYPALTIYN